MFISATGVPASPVRIGLFSGHLIGAPLLIGEAILLHAGKGMRRIICWLGHCRADKVRKESGKKHEFHGLSLQLVGSMAGLARHDTVAAGVDVTVHAGPETSNHAARIGSFADGNASCEKHESHRLPF